MDIKIKDNSQLNLTSFTQLEYIESTGTQYIDTGFKPLVNDEFEISYMITGTTGSYNSVFGTRVNVASNAFMFGYTSSGSYIQIGNQNIGSLNKGYSQNVKHTIKLESGNLYVDNVLDRSITVNQNTVHDLLLFTLNSNGTPSEFGKCRIYNFTIKRAGVKVLDLIPANKDNILCIYDTVSKTFFYNQGTGDFVAGPEVSPSINVLPDNILLKTTTLYHKNTPNVDGLQLLNNILNAQETAEDVVLNRIRVDIGNVSGSISELMQYVSMTGFNDNYEPQAKPRLVGTWTINNWYTTSQLAQAQAAFDGLTIVGDTNYLLDFSQMAVQVLDPNEDNYNPAVAIILQGQNIGTTMTDAPLGYGRWCLTKSQAAAVTSVGTWFSQKTTVSDTNGIVSSDTTATYNFESFDEFRFFGTTFLANDVFKNCTMLSSIILSTTIQSINDHANGGNNFFNTQIESINIEDTQVTSIPKNCFKGCSKLKSISSTKITLVSSSSFENCQNLEYCNFPNLVVISEIAFANCSSLKTIIFSNNLTRIGSGNIGSSFIKCVNLELDELPSTLTLLSAGTFNNCPKITISELPVGVTTLYSSAVYNNTFNNCQSIPYLHILYQGVLTRNDSIWGNFKIYVGDGSSSAHDDAILADYLADSAWSSYSTRLDTWYNYLHPTT